MGRASGGATTLSGETGSWVLGEMTEVVQEGQDISVTDLEAGVEPPGTVEKVEEPRDSEKISLVPVPPRGKEQDAQALQRKPTSGISMLSPSVRAVLPLGALCSGRA